MRAARVLALATVGTLALGGSLLGTAPAAQAHNYLVSSTPESGEVLSVLPDLFEITTNEPLLDTVGDGSFALEVRDEAGLYYGDGCVDISGPSITTAAALGEPGDYTVIWQVVSADGHTVSAEYPFTWAPADATAAVSEGSTEAPSCSGTDQEGGVETSDVPAADDSAAAESAEPADLGNVLWIGGAIVLVGATVGLTLLLTGRKKK